MAKFFYWLLPFYLLSFVMSTAGQEIFGWAIFLLFLFNIAFDFKKIGFTDSIKNLKIGADIPVLFFWTWALLSTQVVFNDLRELGATFSEVRWVFLLYGYSYLMKKYFSLEYEKHYKFLLVSTALVGLYGIVQMFTRIDLVRSTNLHMSEIGDLYRATGFFTVPLTYAYCIGMLGMFAFTSLLINIKENKSYILPLITTISTIGAVIASSTRGAWIAFFVAVMTMTLIMDRKKAALTFVISLLVAGPMMLEPTIQKRAISIFNLKSYASNTERIDLWRTNFEIFKDNPIFGVGLERSQLHLAEYYQKLNIEHGFHGHAHNDFLYILSGVGFPGTIAWLWLCGYFIFLAFKLYKNSIDYRLQVLTLGALGAQIYIHVGGLTQCNFSDNEINHILVFTWALLVGIKAQFDNLNRPKRLSDK